MYSSDRFMGVIALLLRENTKDSVYLQKCTKSNLRISMYVPSEGLYPPQPLLQLYIHFISLFLKFHLNLLMLDMIVVVQAYSFWAAIPQTLVSEI